MKIRISLFALLVLAVSPLALRAQAGGAGAARGGAEDVKAIAAVESHWEAAWNRHDVDAMVRLFAPDADVVNLAGEWFQGREAFAKSLEGLHSAKTKESVWHTGQIQTRFVAPGMAIVHVYFSSTGERNPDGTPMPPRRGIFTRVEEKRDGHWLIVASQATNIVPRETAGAIDKAWGVGADRAIAELRP
ncbi:MAG TPA: SgcJ/EcaC family oxidoreductase [Candidatus Acidoferrales bacterium]|nr:SgcJ/EcaC family oxidoreductase [Candidatus Acidoferrales bacterium]